MKRINAKKNNRKKEVLIIIVVLIFSFFIGSFLVLSNRNYLLIESAFKSLSSSINSYVLKNTYSKEDIINMFDYENEVLKKENEELKKSLDLKKTNYNYILGEVVNRTTKDWFNKVTINKGSKDMIETKLPVINSEGLVGFISKTGKSISEVSLLTSINENNIISCLVDTKEGYVQGMLSSYDKKNKLFKVTNVLTKNAIKKDSYVILSGYGNDSYKGIRVGKVIGEKSSDNGLSKTIMVKSFVSFDELTYVMVVNKK